MEIPKGKELEKKVFAITNEKEFRLIALEIFRFQFYNNPLYHDYCKAVGLLPDNISEVEAIPFLPISFFKSHRVETTIFTPKLVFRSSGTTASTSSSHFVKDPRVYQESFTVGFKKFYGAIENYCILGLLPSYLERGNSSLVHMVECLIQASKKAESGFYLRDFEKLNNTLQLLESSGQKTILIGVSFALLDFGNQYPSQLNSTIIMETGGMKGRGAEMTKVELNDRLKALFGVDHVHSEYGMTELLSQAYGIDGVMTCPPWMKVFLRDETDPFAVSTAAGTGAINIVDLANLYSCSFIETDDVGRLRGDGGFEVMGRMDNSDMRGCSLMVV